MPGRTSGSMQSECRTQTPVKLPFSARTWGSGASRYASFCMVFPYGFRTLLGPRPIKSESAILDMSPRFWKRGEVMQIMRSERHRISENLLRTPGGGALYTNINLPAGDTSSFNFSARGGGGLRVFTQPRQSIEIGCRWSHISNANLGVRNPEFSGVQVSVEYQRVQVSDVKMFLGGKNRGCSEQHV
jgi:hypothetical protein